jgi:hypothetical protein
MSTTTKCDSTSNSDNIGWKKCESTKGAGYEVGARVEWGNADSQADERKEAFSISVNWPVRGDDSWQQTSDEVRDKAGITYYRYYRNSSRFSFWQYCLEFRNEENYNYSFMDATGDTYGVNTWQRSNHYVTLSSANPTITTISGN